MRNDGVGTGRTRDRSARHAGRQGRAGGQAVPAPMKSLYKGLLALDALQQVPSLRTTDLAQILCIDKGLASRILQTLVQAGYARRSDDRTYSIEPKIAARHDPRRHRMGIRQRARPLLRRLVELTGESAHLGILADDQVLYLERDVPDVPLKVDRPVGTLAPLDVTALGKVLLAYSMDAGEIEPGFGSHRPSLPEAECRQILERGFSVDDEGLFIGVRCVAAPVRDESGAVVGAVSLSGPTARIDRERLMQLGALIKEQAARFGRI